MVAQISDVSLPRMPLRKVPLAYYEGRDLKESYLPHKWEGSTWDRHFLLTLWKDTYLQSRGEKCVRERVKSVPAMRLNARRSSCEGSKQDKSQRQSGLPPTQIIQRLQGNVTLPSRTNSA